MRTVFRSCGAVLILTLLTLSACQQGSSTSDSSANSDSKAKEEQTSKGESKIVKKSFQPSEKKSATGEKTKSTKPATKIVKKSFSSGSQGSFATKSFGAGSRTSTNLTRAILDYANESQQVNPTVVVWLLDRTKSATKLREKVISEIKLAKPAADQQTFESLFAGFSAEGLDPVSSEPVSDPAKIESMLKQMEEISSEKESTFTCLNQCVEKFAYLRNVSRKTVIFVLVTDESGDDGTTKIENKNIVDVVASKLNKLSTPLFVIGYAAPFGRETDLVQGKKTETMYGPETAALQRLSLAMWNGSTDHFRYDSGFGPWNLEKLCRASGGRFLADRPAKRSMRIVSKMQSNWPAVTSRQFKDSVMSRYKPFYGSLERYQQDVNENKAKLALHNAAALPYTTVFRMQDYEFREASEAARIREINVIQRIPAVIQPGLEKLYTILKTGEADRDMIKSKRWQVSFDLAYGRTLANYVRVIGLNSMLAELKGGKKFANPDSNSWVLVPSEEVNTGSSNRRMADKAKMYLQRVIDEHAETPWALIAKKELESPLGWKWEEAKR